MNAPLLSAEGLRRVIGGRVVVDVGALRVEQGEVVALLGPNGAGKSTLLRMLLLLERPDAGSVRLGGRAVAPGDVEARRRLAATLQRPYLFTGTVLSNASFALRARGISARDAERRALSVLNAMGLAERAGDEVAALSGGEAQRVAVARALVAEPDLLALDEPTAGFDVVVRRSFREHLDGLIRRHAGGCLLVTHDPAEAFMLADRVYVLEGGRVVQVGAPDELVAHPATPFVATFTGAELLLDGSVVHAADSTVTIEAGRSVRLVAVVDHALEAGARVHIAYRPEDVLLAPARPEVETSARNRLRGRIISTTPAGGLVRVRLGGELDLVALVTREAAERLELSAGREVMALIKATALRAFAAQEHDAREDESERLPSRRSVP